MMMSSMLPAVGLGLVKGLLLAQLLKPTKPHKSDHGPPPSYGYQVLYSNVLYCIILIITRSHPMDMTTITLTGCTDRETLI